MPLELDSEDRRILAKRTALFNRQKGPRVGDFIVFADEVTRRIARVEPENGSPDRSVYLSDAYFYLSEKEGVLHNTRLHRPVQIRHMELTDKRRTGSAWTFHHGISTEHNGVNVEIRFRVYRCSELAPTV